jgi:hypothetical protein
MNFLKLQIMGWGKMLVFHWNVSIQSPKCEANRCFFWGELYENAKKKVVIT